MPEKLHKWVLLGGKLKFKPLTQQGKQNKNKFVEPQYVCVR